MRKGQTVWRQRGMRPGFAASLDQRFAKNSNSEIARGAPSGPNVATTRMVNTSPAGPARSKLCGSWMSWTSSRWTEPSAPKHYFDVMRDKLHWGLRGAR